MSTANRPVVIGVDGSQASQNAVRWGMALAGRRDCPALLLHASDPTMNGILLGHGRGDLSSAMYDAARSRLEAAYTLATAAEPGRAVTKHLVDAAATRAMIDASHRAEALVLGAQGVSGFRSLAAGSTAMQVTAHASCPVVTVPTSESWAHGGSGVVVGVDGSALSAAAIGFAFREASDTGASLTAVLAWSDSLAWGVISAALPTHEDVLSNARHARDLLTAWLTPWCEKYPDVVVRQRVVSDIPVRALAAASEGAQLLVVGCRGRSVVSSMLLGSVSHGVLHLATCPVAVLHGEAAATEIAGEIADAGTTTETLRQAGGGRSTLVPGSARELHR